VIRHTGEPFSRYLPVAVYELIKIHGGGVVSPFRYLGGVPAGHSGSNKRATGAPQTYATSLTERLVLEDSSCCGYQEATGLSPGVVTLLLIDQPS
jgi:hypothetical protein